MDKRPESVLFLLSRVLGGKTFSAQLMRAVETMENIRPHFVFLDEDDFARHRNRVPLPNRLAGLFVGSSILRWKLRKDPPPPHRAVFIQSFELSPACSVLDPRVPSIIAHDSTNILSYRLIRDSHPGPLSDFVCGLKSILVTPTYHAALRRARAFLPRTHWCAGSLVKDFGVDPRRIIVAPAGLDTVKWSPPEKREIREVPRLLFVGNDFERKGGQLLLDIFTKHIHPRASLRIISNDPSLEGKVWPPGVEHLRGLGPARLEALVDAYRSSDLFVFPTRKEHMGMVLTEACAVGLPIIATNVGGVWEAVRPGENGLLISRDAGEEAWTAAILDLIENREKREAFGRRSREMAEQEFSLPSLRQRVAAAFAKLA